MAILLGNDVGLYGALLAHNLGHLAGRHQQDTGRGLIFLNALGYELIPDYTPARQVAPLGLEAIGGAYSDNQEQEADSLALALLSKARLDEKALIRLYEVLKTNAAAAGSFIPTHPNSEERVRSLRRMIEASLIR
jgi:predicted Zn-dependent protease